jgi:hypothetical protein
MLVVMLGETLTVPRISDDAREIVVVRSDCSCPDAEREEVKDAPTPSSSVWVVAIPEIKTTRDIDVERLELELPLPEMKLDSRMDVSSRDEKVTEPSTDDSREMDVSMVAET